MFVFKLLEPSAPSRNLEAAPEMMILHVPTFVGGQSDIDSDLEAPWDRVEPVVNADHRIVPTMLAHWFKLWIMWTRIGPTSRTSS
jgi:hypothetical protein